MGDRKFIPKYRRIYEDIRRGIRSGRYLPGALLPCERELCGQYGVERITVRSALRLLSEEGLIVKKPGVGSFVSGSEAVPSPTGSGSATALFLMSKSIDYIHSNSPGFNALLFFPMEQLCREKGISLMFRSCIEGDDIADIVSSSRAGFVFMVSTLPEHIYDEVYRIGIPALCVNHYDRRFVSVMPDSKHSIREVISYLSSLGHKRIAFLNGLPAASNAVERLHAFRCAMFEEKLTLDEGLIMEGDWTYNSGFACMTRLLDERKNGCLPTAVVAGNDMIAIGCMEAIRSRGLRVPEDISVVGFDNIGMSRFCTPLLTTVSVDPVMMARVGVAQMMNLLDPSAFCVPCAIYPPAALVKRESVCPPRVKE